MSGLTSLLDLLQPCSGTSTSPSLLLDIIGDEMDRTSRGTADILNHRSTFRIFLWIFRMNISFYLSTLTFWRRIFFSDFSTPCI